MGKDRVVIRGGHALEDRVASRLSQLGVRFVERPVAMGLYPDFLIGLRNDRNLVVEVKESPLTDETLALKQLSHYVSALGAFAGVLVVNEPRPPKMIDHHMAIVGIDELPDALKELEAT